MKKISILTLFVLCSCATGASYNSACFEEHEQFDMAVACTKQKLNNDPRSNLPINHSFMNTLYPYMDMVSSDVEKKKISEAQGRYLIAEKIAELTSAQRAQVNEARMLDALTTPKSVTTNCHTMGQNSVSCTTH